MSCTCPVSRFGPGPVDCGLGTDHCPKGLGNVVFSCLSYLFPGACRGCSLFLTGQASGSSPTWPGWVLVVFLRGEKGLSGAYSECVNCWESSCPARTWGHGTTNIQGRPLPLLPGLSSLVAWCWITCLLHPQCPGSSPTPKHKLRRPQAHQSWPSPISSLHTCWPRSLEAARLPRPFARCPLSSPEAGTPRMLTSGLTSSWKPSQITVPTHTSCSGKFQELVGVKK